MITIYDNTGKIVLTVQTEDEEVINAHLNRIASDPTLNSINGIYDPTCFVIENNVPIDLGKSPGSDYYIDYASKSWKRNLTKTTIMKRNIRDALLLESDWTDTLSSRGRLGPAKYGEWKTYRQALRDITLQPGFPTDVIWPVQPQ